MRVSAGLPCTTLFKVGPGQNIRQLRPCDNTGSRIKVNRLPATIMALFYVYIFAVYTPNKNDNGVAAAADGLSFLVTHFN